MNAIERPDDSSERAFHYSTIFAWGLFDKDSEESRFMRRRMWIGSLVFVVGLFFFARLRQALGPELGPYALVPFGLFATAWIGSGFVQYLRRLDEMQRQIQYESIAVTYGIVMVVAMVAACVQPSTGRLVDPLNLVFAEIVRNLALVVAAWRRA